MCTACSVPISVCSNLILLNTVVLVCRTVSDHYCVFFFFQAEDGIRDLVRSRGLGDVYKRQSDKLDVDLRGRIRALEIENQLRQIFDGVDVVVGGLSLIHI